MTKFVHMKLLKNLQILDLHIQQLLYLEKCRVEWFKKKSVTDYVYPSI